MAMSRRLRGGVASVPNRIAAIRPLVVPLVHRQAVRRASNSISADEFGQRAADEEAGEELEQVHSHQQQPKKRPNRDEFAAKIISDLGILEARRRRRAESEGAEIDRQPAQEEIQTTANEPRSANRAAGPPSVQSNDHYIRRPPGVPFTEMIAMRKARGASLITPGPQLRLVVLRRLPKRGVDSKTVQTALRGLVHKSFPRFYSPFRLVKCGLRDTSDPRTAVAFLEFFDTTGASEVYRKACNGELQIGGVIPQASIHDVEEEVPLEL